VLRATVSLPGTDGPSPNLDVLDLLAAQIRIWSRWLSAHREFPKLYQAGIEYRPEEGTENWLSPPEVLQLGYGDCEDLTIWRCAELVASGNPCRPQVKGRAGPAGGFVQHVFVGYPDGRTEDPSLILLPKGFRS
jgi:hypothetical protein